MTARDALRRTALLAIVQGLCVALAGPRAIRLLRRLVPPWCALWLAPLERAPHTVIQGLGVLEVLAGLRLLALVPGQPTSATLGASVSDNPRANPLSLWERVRACPECSEGVRVVPASASPRVPSFIDLIETASSLTHSPLRTIWSLTTARVADETLVDLLHEFVAPGARVLDLGCGDGDNLARLLSEGLTPGSYLGVDSSRSNLARARARFDGLPKIDFVRNDFLNEQLPSGEFDLILSTWSLDQMPDPFSVVVRAMRQLREGGHILLLFLSPVHDRRASLLSLAARLTRRQLRPPSIYTGLPNVVAVEQFARGLITLVVIERPVPVASLVGEPPPEWSTDRMSK